ncbi:MAG: hypothetical protein IJC07_06565 [Clostridia bacterium]|nr:hypothetical protein [Clostridia bacterium]
MNRKEIKEKVRQRRIKKALRCYRLRPLKNFFMWLSGVLTSFAILLGAIFVGIKIVPVKTYVGEDVNNYVSDKIANKSILDVLLDIDEYELTDVPAAADLVLGLVDELGLSAYIELDEEKVKALQLTYDDPNKTFMSEFQACIKVVATMDSVGLTEMLGDMASLSAFSEWKQVGAGEITFDSNGNIAKDGEGNLYQNPAQYYYLPKDVGPGVAPFAVQEPDPENDKHYQRAFDDEGNKLYHEGATLYYAKLSAITIVDALDLIDESFGRIEITELLNVGGADVADGDMIYELLEGKKISEVGDIGPESIYVYNILGGEKDGDMYKILSSALGGKAVEEISFADFTSEDFKIDSITLATFLGEYSDENVMHKILDNAVEGKAYEQVTIEDLSSGLEIEGIPLNTILGDASDLYDILIDCVDDDDVVDADDLTIGHLSGGLTFDGIKIEKFLGEYDAENVLHKILCDVTGDAFGDITISGLTSIENFDGVKLVSVLGEDSLSGSEFANILDQAFDVYDEDGNLVTDKSYGDVTVGEIASLNIDNVTLSSVMTIGADTELAKILNEAFDVYDEDGNLVEDNSYTSITVGEISSLKINNVKLATVMTIGADSELAKILDQAFDTATKDYGYEEVTVGQISSLKVDNVSVSSIMDITAGSTIANILDEAFDTDTKDYGYQDIKVGQIASLSVDNVSLSSVMTIGADSILAKILDQAFDTATKDYSYQDIKVSQMASLDVTNVKLASVLEIASGSTLANILDQAFDVYDEGGNLITDRSHGQITIGEISSLNIDNAKISTILPTVTDEFKAILEDVTDKDYEDIMIVQLSTINVNDASLTCVIKYAGNESLYSILWQATNQAGDLTSETAENIKISALGNGGFKVEEVYLDTVMNLDADSDLAKILDEAFDTEYEDVSYGDLKVKDMNNFTIDNVRLSTVMDPTGNVIMDKLIAKGVTIANIGTEINKLTLYEVYGEDCFKDTEVVGSPLYYEDLSTLTYYLADYAPAEIKVDANKRWLCENDGIWLVFCFDAGEIIEDGEHKGRAKSYKASTTTLMALQSHEEDGIASISGKFEYATIRQLIDAGIINDMHDGLYAMTLHEAIDKLSKMSEAGLLTTT